jgi:hypothetical protein
MISSVIQPDQRRKRNGGIYSLKIQNSIEIIQASFLMEERRRIIREVLSRKEIASEETSFNPRKLILKSKTSTRKDLQYKNRKDCLGQSMDPIKLILG